MYFLDGDPQNGKNIGYYEHKIFHFSFSLFLTFSRYIDIKKKELRQKDQELYKI